MRIQPSTIAQKIEEIKPQHAHQPSILFSGAVTVRRTVPNAGEENVERTANRIDTPNPWQPTLEGRDLIARPLQASDFDALFAAASDPGIWELHPVPDRYTRPKFEIYFQTGIASNGALVVEDRHTGQVIGSSRFTAHDPVERKVEIGYTFLVRDHWGKGTNKELKSLMLAHAFQHVDLVEFVVGVRNLRSRAAMEKIGGKLVRTLVEREPEGDLRESVVYVIAKEDGIRP